MSLDKILIRAIILSLMTSFLTTTGYKVGKHFNAHIFRASGARSGNALFERVFSTRGGDDWAPYKPSIDVTRPKISGAAPSWRGDATKKKESHDNRYSPRGDSRGDSRSDSRGDSRRNGDFRGGKSNSFRKGDRKPNRYGEKEEKSEPIYGHYDGDHIYGINPVLLALRGKRRHIQELILQEDIDTKVKKDSALQEIIELADKASIPVRHFSKHDLNMMSDNRPHQGAILRAKPLSFLKAEPLPKSDNYK